MKLDKGELPVIGTSEGVFDNHRLPPVEKAVESTPPGLTLCIDSNTPTYSSVAAEAKFSKAELPPIDTPEGVAKHILASHSRASTPTYASVAAEVADSATFLNEEKPETPIPDELAGEIGYRRLSSTPIAEVANTAAEVADTAQRLDDPEVSIVIRSKQGELTLLRRSLGSISFQSAMIQVNAIAFKTMAMTKLLTINRHYSRMSVSACMVSMRLDVRVRPRRTVIMIWTAAKLRRTTAT